MSEPAPARSWEGAVRHLRWTYLLGLLLLCLFINPSRGIAADPAWQVSAPRDGVWRYTQVELGLRNKWGAYGECYWVDVEVYDPWGDVAQGGNGWVCSDDWSYWTFERAYYRGWYWVYYAIDGWVIAEDKFWVY